MKSDVIHVNNDGSGIAEALKEAEAVAVYKSLSKKDSIHLQLLAEEMMGMFKGLTGEHNADFWIEDEDESRTFRLHLKAEVSVNAEMRRKLLSASTSGENIAAKGVTGKIRDLFNRILEPSDDPVTGAYAQGWYSAVPDFTSMSTAEAAAAARIMAPVSIWSFNKYKSAAGTDMAEKENWDELEKSVVANLADEIEIGIKERSVEMIIYKKCTAKELTENDNP